MSRRRWFLWMVVGLFVILNAVIVHREVMHDEVLFAELEKVVTPQKGDRVWLYYDIGEAIEGRVGDDVEKGRAVVGVDDENKASFRRLDDGSPLADDERMLRWKKKRGRIVVGPVYFRVERGTAGHYEGAEYIRLHATSRGSAYAVELLDRNFEPITVR